MRNELLTLPLLAVAGIFGTGTFPSERAKPVQHFDYSTANHAERTTYLHALGAELKNKFRPSFTAKIGTHSVGGRSITFSYNMRVNQIDCDTDHSCKVMQCNRYLKLPVSQNNISVRIRYLNAKGKQIGTQMLKNSTCAAIIEKWKVAYIH